MDTGVCIHYIILDTLWIFSEKSWIFHGYISMDTGVCIHYIILDTLWIFSEKSWIFYGYISMDTRVCIHYIILDILWIFHGYLAYRGCVSMNILILEPDFAVSNSYEIR